MLTKVLSSAKKNRLTQVFSCISRALNTHNALSLPKLQRICNDAYKTKSVISHTVLENNLAWFDWLEPYVVPKSLMASGLLKVRLRPVHLESLKRFVLS